MRDFIVTIYKKQGISVLKGGVKKVWDSLNVQNWRIFRNRFDQWAENIFRIFYWEIQVCNVDKERNCICERSQFFASVCGEACKVGQSHSFPDAWLTYDDKVCVSSKRLWKGQGSGIVNSRNLWPSGKIWKRVCNNVFELRRCSRFDRLARSEQERFLEDFIQSKELCRQMHSLRAAQGCAPVIFLDDVRLALTRRFALFAPTCTKFIP